MVHILPLKKVTKQEELQVGEKAVRLALLADRMQVPDGFVITSEAFTSFLKETGLLTRINNLIAPLAPEDTDSLQDVANKVQKLIVTTKIPAELQEELCNHYICLNFSDQKKPGIRNLIDEASTPLVAVRSSACGYEDYAKLHVSFVNIRGVDRFVQAVLASWASFYMAKAIAYRMLNEIEHASYALIVQRMVNAERSGIMFSTNPLNKNEILLVGCRGIGSPLVHGLIIPDTYSVDKDSLQVLQVDVKKQEFIFEHDDYLNKTRRTALRDQQATEQKLSERQIVDLASYAKRIEKLFCAPQRVEFAIEKDQYYFLQSQDILGLEGEESAAEDHTHEVTMPSTEHEYEEEKDEASGYADDIQPIAHDENAEATLEAQEASTHVSTQIDAKGELAFYEELARVSSLTPHFFNKGNMVIAADLAIYAALKGKYKELFQKETNSDFIRLLNDLTSQVPIPYEQEMRMVHTLRNKYLRSFEGPQDDEVEKTKEIASKCIRELKTLSPKQE